MKPFRITIDFRFKIIIAIVLLICSTLLTVYMLFTPQPIQIILETGQAVVTQSSSYFTISTVIILVLCSFMIGASITYLFYNSENNHVFKKTEEHQQHNINYDMIMPLLKDDEKKAVHIIREHNGEMLQNELVLKLGHSKVRTTRILSSLERKQIIQRHRHGLTNSIKLKH
jgi:hypothetical protein